MNRFALLGEQRALPEEWRPLLASIATTAEEVVGAPPPAMRLKITSPRVEAWNTAAAHAALTGHCSAVRLIGSRASAWWLLRHRNTAAILVHPSSVRLWANAGWLKQATELQFIEHMSSAVIEAMLLARGSAPALHILALAARYGIRATDDHLIADAVRAEKDRKAELEEALPTVLATLRARSAAISESSGNSASRA